MSTFEKVPPITIHQEGQHPQIHAFSADKEGVYKDQIETEDSRNLKGCLGVLEDTGVFFRSESLDTPQKTIQFSRITRFAYLEVRKKGRPFRCTCCQLGVIDREADLIMNQHLHVMKLNKGQVDPVPFAHLFLPTEPLYYKPLRERVFGTSLNDLELISQQVSNEGLATYAYWLSEEYEKMIPTFNYSATEEYELEMRLNNYIHQARSEVLKSVKADIIHTLQQMDKLMAQIQGKPISEKESQQLIEFEKQLIHAREELKQYIDTIINQLYNVQVAIEKIAVTHPELEQLYYATVTLKSMMLQWDRPFSNWSQKSLIHSVMDQQLGVITLFNSYQNDNRSLFSFAVRYALLALYSTETESDWVEIVINWYEHVRRLHRHHMDNGHYPPQDRRLNLVYQLRELILSVFLSIRKEGYVVGGKQANTEFLSLLPVFGKCISGETVQLLKIDTQTYEAIDFMGEVDDLIAKLK